MIEWKQDAPCPDCGEPYGTEHPRLVDAHGKRSRWVCARCAELSPFSRFVIGVDDAYGKPLQRLCDWLARKLARFGG